MIKKHIQLIFLGLLITGCSFFRTNDLNKIGGTVNIIDPSGEKISYSSDFIESDQVSSDNKVYYFTGYIKDIGVENKWLYISVESISNRMITFHIAPEEKKVPISYSVSVNAEQLSLDLSSVREITTVDNLLSNTAVKKAVVIEFKPVLDDDMTRDDCTSKQCREYYDTINNKVNDNQSIWAKLNKNESINNSSVYFPVNTIHLEK